MDLIERLRSTRSDTLDHFRLEGPGLDARYAPGKWSVREILHHLSDAETVLFDRIRRVISERRQVIWAFDQDAWASGLGYSERPLALSRALFDAAREGVLYYAERHLDRAHELEFVHSETGIRTLRDELEKVADHNRHHLEQIESALRRG